MNVRPYQPKDFERMHKICFETSSGFDSEKGRVALFATYCDYYVNEEPENCFVAVNENDEAIGYVICSSDPIRYERVFKEKYAPVLKKASPVRYLFHVVNEWLCRRIKKEYPAHLHIDILPEGQRMGLGTRLMDALTDHLKKNGVKGVYLVCGAGNEKGVNFYKKYGFKVLSEKLGSVTFALKFSS